MALPRRFGKPDLFITVTCNPQWPEITSALPVGAKWRDHPDIVARAFMMRLKCIVHDFKEGCIFGVLKAFVYRIEWQARGLPHVHMLLIFASSGSTCPFPAPTPTPPPTLQTTLHNDGHQEALHAVPPITSPSLAAPRSTRAASLQLQ